MEMSTDRLSPSEMLEMYCTMVLIREFEELTVELYKLGKLPGFLHPSVGQEASAAGFTSTLIDGDYLITTHRGHGHLLGRSVDIRGMVAELYGRTDGLCAGLGGSMHVADLKRGILGANGIVGAGIPIACGAGLANQLDDCGSITVVFFGDGAVNIGAFHEGLNLAALWGLPVVFICENNQYAESTRFEDAIPTRDLGGRAESYAMPFRRVDGNDIEACVGLARRVVASVRANGGPVLVQVDTYRWYGHHTGDTAPYRTDDELASWKARDPIASFRSALLELGADEDTIASIEAEVAEQLAAAEDAARSAPDPDPSELLHGVFAEVLA